MAKLSSTENPQGIGAVVKIKAQPALTDFAWNKRAGTGIGME